MQSKRKKYFVNNTCFWLYGYWEKTNKGDHGRTTLSQIFLQHLFPL